VARVKCFNIYDREERSCVARTDCRLHNSAAMYNCSSKWLVNEGLWKEGTSFNSAMARSLVMGFFLLFPMVGLYVQGGMNFLSLFITSAVDTPANDIDLVSRKVFSLQ